MLLTVSKYAAECGVSSTVIYRRIKSGEIVPIQQLVKNKPTHKGYLVTLIDSDRFPLVGEGKRGRRLFVG